MKEEKKKIERTRTTTKGRKWWQQVAVRAVAGKATLTVWQQWSEKSSKNESQKVNSSGRIHQAASPPVTTPAKADVSTLHASPSLALQHLDSPDRATLSKLYDTVAIQCCPLLLSPEFL